MTTTDKERIAALEAEIDKIKAAQAPVDRAAEERKMKEWANEAHQMAERRMSQAYAWSPAELRAFEAAAPTHTVKGIALKDGRAPVGPSSAGKIPPSTPRPTAGGGTGWREAVPLGPVPGIAQVDRMLDAADGRDRHDLLVQEARRQALDQMASRRDDKK